MKKIKRIIKLQIPAGKANPAPPVGPMLGQHGLNIQDFCSKFNAATKTMGDDIVVTKITVYEDRSYDFVIKTPLTSNMLKRAAKIEKGAKKAKEKAGSVTMSQVTEIAEKKMRDLNTNNINEAIKIILGTAKSMGITVEK